MSTFLLVFQSILSCYYNVSPIRTEKITFLVWCFNVGSKTRVWSPKLYSINIKIMSLCICPKPIICDYSEWIQIFLQMTAPEILEDNCLAVFISTSQKSPILQAFFCLWSCFCFHTFHFAHTLKCVKILEINLFSF